MFGRNLVQSRQGELRCAQQLTIHSERHGQTHVVELIGELDMQTARAFEDELKRVEATDAQEIIVDLSALKFINSDGLRAFIHANARSRRAGNRLMLVRGPDQVHKTFETSGLLPLLPFAA